MLLEFYSFVSLPHLLIKLVFTNLELLVEASVFDETLILKVHNTNVTGSACKGCKKTEFFTAVKIKIKSKERSYPECLVSLQQ